ncbi:MAG TPA: indole-3-glycerol phosphate synthase TrpC [Caulobacteraceae bacterium]|jgi:indole-3-glycerol phosphate synthase
MSDILERIATYKRDDVRARKKQESQADIELRAQRQSAPREFRRALERAHAPGRLALIAEIKRASPSRGLVRVDFDPANHAKAYERGGATCLSVLTDGPSFQGDNTHLHEAREAGSLPCLRKEFLVDPWQVAESRSLGADAILVILALAPDSLASELISEARRFKMDVLVEAHDRAEVRRAVRLKADLIGVNNRDLRTFVTDLAVTEELSEEVPPSALLVTESGILSQADAARLERAGAKAMLVGESLMRAADLEAATRALLAGQG